MNPKPKLTKQALLAHGPCRDGRRFILKHTTLSAAWRKCKDPHHLAWALARMAPLTIRMKKKLGKLVVAHLHEHVAAGYPHSDSYYVRRCIGEAAEGFLWGAMDHARYALGGDTPRGRKEGRWQCDLVREHVKPFARSARQARGK